MTGLNTKTTSIESKLDTMIELLGQVIELLGGTPPEETVTLSDLLAVLEDIHLDTISMDQKLLIIRNAIKDPSESDIDDPTPSISWNVYRLRKAIATPSLPAPELGNIHSLAYGIESIVNSLMAINNAHLGNIYSVVSNGLSNVGLNVSSSSEEYSGYLFDALNWMGRTSGGIGVPADADNRNVIELLARIADRPESPIGSGLRPSDLCIDAYVSTGMILVPGLMDPIWPSIVYAVFGTAPTGDIEYGSIFGIGIDYTELENTTGSWFGWSVYVASEAANFGMQVSIDIGDSLKRFPTNSWVTIQDAYPNISFYVGASASIRVYMCNPGWGGGSGGGGPWEPLPGDGGGPWEGCVTIASANTIVTHPNSAVSAITYTPMSELSGVSYTDTLEVSGGGAYITDAPDSIAVGNFNGVQITLLTASSGVRAYFQKADLSFVVHSFSGMGDTFLIDQDTITMAVDTFTGGTSVDYEVEICSPT